MKTKNLKTGHILVYASGEKALVALDTEDGDKYIKMKEDNDSWWTHGDISSLPNDLEYPEDSSYHSASGGIVEVLKPKKDWIAIQQDFERSNYEVVWKMPKKKAKIEITVKINGEEKSLSSLSEETLLNLRKEE